MNQDEAIQSALKAYDVGEFPLDQFFKRIIHFFSYNPKLTKGPLPVIHSIKYRLKDKNHLVDKIKRKWDEKGPINGDNLFEKITDLAGVRILHLYPSQFSVIHEEIINQVKAEEWFFDEDPKAYTWDPEFKLFYEDLNIHCELKHSCYTSVHYLVKPRADSPYRCEIQVRTLFEEIWSEIDHTINYPFPTGSVACKEQLKVLARLASTGTKLADSIFLSHEEFNDKNVGNYSATQNQITNIDLGVQ